MRTEFEMENNKNCSLDHFTDPLKLTGFTKNALAFFCFKAI